MRIKNVATGKKSLTVAWEDGDFPPQPNPLCGWCDFMEICPEGQAYQKERDAVGGEQVDLPF